MNNLWVQCVLPKHTCTRRIFTVTFFPRISAKRWWCTDLDNQGLLRMTSSFPFADRGYPTPRPPMKEITWPVSIRFSLSYVMRKYWLPRPLYESGERRLLLQYRQIQCSPNKCTTYVRHRLTPIPRSTKIFTIQQRTRLAIAIILYYIIRASSALDNFALFVFFIFRFFFFHSTRLTRLFSRLRRNTIPLNGCNKYIFFFFFFTFVFLHFLHKINSE